MMDKVLTVLGGVALAGSALALWLWMAWREMREH